MKKLIIAVMVIAGLAISANARVIDSFNKSDFKYDFNFNTQECALTQESLSNSVYGIVENRIANFVKVDIGGSTYNVFGMRQNGEDVFILFFDSFEVCQKVQNLDLSAQYTMHNIVKYTHLVAEECSIKTDLETTEKIMIYHEKGYSIKSSVEKFGLSCNK